MDVVFCNTLEEFIKKLNLDSWLYSKKKVVVKLEGYLYMPLVEDKKLILCRINATPTDIHDNQEIKYDCYYTFSEENKEKLMSKIAFLLEEQRAEFVFIDKVLPFRPLYELF